MTILERIRGGLIVSCQAPPGSPLRGPIFMAAMARAAEQAGAVGIRADGPVDIAAIREATSLPIIGIFKRRDLDPEVYITPRFEEVLALRELGVEIVALDGTDRPRPDGSTLKDLLKRVKTELPDVLIMADCSTVEEGIRAAELGADLVSTTLAGYTPYSRQQEGPDLELVSELVAAVSVPVICEGRIWEPTQAVEALERGAWAVVVGRAITHPVEIAMRFTRALAGRRVGTATTR